MTKQAEKPNASKHHFAPLKSALSWVFMIAAYGYVLYILISYKHYDEFFAQFRNISAIRYSWLWLVLALLPVNLLTEALKWQRIVSKSEKLTITAALKAVLAGFSTGFFTPNRIAEPVGRILFLKPENRKTGIVYSVINSFTQNIVMAMCGLPALAIFLSLNKFPGLNHQVYIGIVSAILVVILAVCFSLPAMARSRFWQTHLSFAADISHLSTPDLLSIISISLLRYAVFGLQMFAMLQFFGVELQWWQALVAIPSSYLLVTFTPSLAFSEAAIRSSYAVIFVGAFTPQPAAIAFAGLALWLINFGLPMLVGVAVLTRIKRPDYQ